jgi:cytochrome c oxidase subunit 3
MNDRQAHLHEQFESLDQQHSAATQGIWIFIATEILFFGAMFFAYAIYRRTYPAAFSQMSQQLDWRLGTLNTAILLTSSFTMALGVRAAEQGKKKALSWFLSITLGLGLLFLAVKGFEYRDDWNKSLVFGSSFPFVGEEAPQMKILLFLYYLMTAIHGLHLLIGVGVLSVMISKNQKDTFSSHYYSPIEVTGLYWHFVDVIWLFLYPLLYLIGKPHL